MLLFNYVFDSLLGYISLSGHGSWVMGSVNLKDMTEDCTLEGENRLNDFLNLSRYN